MRNLQRITLSISMLVFCLASKGSAQSAYTVTDLGTLPGGNLSRGHGINNSGQATGFSRTSTPGLFDAFLYSAGAMVDLGTLPNGITSTGFGINSSGQVTGTSTPDASSNNGEHAFLYSAGAMIDLGTLGTNTWDKSEGYGINTAGQVTGATDLTFAGPHAFLYSAGTMTDLGTLGGRTSDTSVGYGINDSGQVTGYSTTSSGALDAFLYRASTGMVDLGSLPGSAGSSGNAINAFGQVTGGPSPGSTQGDAFLYSASTGMVDLGTLPGGTLSFGLGINEFGQVVGAGNVSTGGPLHAILYTPNQGMVDLNRLIPPGSGWGLGQAYGINNAGQIVGWGGINGATHAFLLTPNGLITPQEMPCGCGSSNASEPQVAGTQGRQGDPVSTAFGSFSESFNDVRVSGRGLPLSFDRSYSSVFAIANGPLGYGWTHNYTMKLIQQGTSLVVAQENGSRVTFNAASGGGYTAPPRVIATLVKNSDGTFTFTRRAQEFFTFSSTGQLTSERDRNGYTTTLIYNGSGQLITVTDPAGRTLTLTYSGSNLSTVTDPIGRKVSFAYDTNGNLSSVSDVNGGKTNFTYSPNHLLLTITDARGGVVTNTYDTSNRVTSQSDQLKRKTVFTYATGTTTTTDPKGNVTQEKYNQINQRVSLTKGFATSSAATWTFTYDPNTQGIAQVTDPNGHLSSNTYDASGNPLTSTDGLGRVTTQTWDSINDLTSVKDPLGVTSTNTYDAKGNLLTRSIPLTGTGKVQTVTYQYSDGIHPGDVTGVVDPNGKTTTFTYDSDGNQITTTDPLGHIAKFGYNGIGWRTSFTDARGKTTTYTQNSFGDVTLTTDPLGHKVTRSYDANRNVTSLKDADGHVTAFTYDAANERTKSTRADGTTLQTVYNADGTVSKTIDGAGNATTYSYDSLARPLSVADPLARTTSNSYDGAGNLVKVTDPSGQITTNSYDAANQITGIAYSDGKTPKVTMVYDADGQRTSMTDGTGTSKWTYDSLHRVATTTTGAGAKVSYAYDLKGQLTKLTYPGGTHSVSRIYDAAGRLTSITDWLGNKSAFVYDPDGNLTSETLPATTGITSNLSYDAASRLTGIVDAIGSTNLATFSYTLDANGQLTGVTETGVPVPGTDTYSYTKLNQLTSVNSSSYSYDAADNVIGLITPSQIQLKYDTANELTTLTAGTATTTFAYDKRGNRLSRTPHTGHGLTYAYDQANRMVDFGSADTYAYAGDGLRMAKTISGKTEAFAWDRSGSLPLLIADGTSSYVYDPQGMPLEQVSGSGTALFYLHDQLGSTRLVSNSSGATQASYTYDAYGNLLGETGTVANPFGYAGQYADSESGLIYLRARYNDPATAQFISRDPLVKFTREAYVYVNDNPLNGVDPAGLWTWRQSWTAITNFSWNLGTKDSPLPLICTSGQDVKDWFGFILSVTAATALNDIAAELPNLNATDAANAVLLAQAIQGLPPGMSPAKLLNGSAIFQQIEITQGKFRPQHH